MAATRTERIHHHTPGGRTYVLLYTLPRRLRSKRPQSGPGYYKSGFCEISPNLPNFGFPSVYGLRARVSCCSSFNFHLSFYHLCQNGVVLTLLALENVLARFECGHTSLQRLKLVFHRGVLDLCATAAVCFVVLILVSHRFSWFSRVFCPLVVILDMC